MSDALTYVGHAAVLADLAGARVLTDPFLTARLGHLRRQVAPPAGSGPLDAVLISHLHRDHLHVPSLRRLDRSAALIVPAGAAGLVAGLGFARVHEVRAGETVTVGPLQVHAVHAEHDGRRPPRGPHAPALGFLLEAAGPARRWWFAGDTDVFPEMADLAPVDLALLPVWGWGTSLGPGHMDPLRAARAAALCGARVAVPIHWGTYFPVGLARRHGHLLHDPPHSFARHVRHLAPACEVRVLAPGERTTLGPPA